MKEYRKVEKGEIWDLFQKVLSQSKFDQLRQYEVRFALIGIKVVESENSTAVEYAIPVKGNLPAAAQVKVCSQKERALAPYDVVIEFDEEMVDSFSERTREALFEHQLTHLELVFDKDGLCSTIDGRPKLKVIPDDFAITGFRAIIAKYGFDSPELISINGVFEQAEKDMAEEEKKREKAAKSSSVSVG